MHAATTVVARDGAPAATLAAVARELGTSIRPVRNRVADRGELLAHLWREFSPALEGVLASGLTATRAQPSALLAALESARTRDDLHDATGELLLFSRFDDVLQAAVAETLAPRIAGWTTPRDDLSATDAARNAFVLSLVLGMYIGARHRRAAQAHLASAVPMWSHALSPVAPQSLPSASAAFITAYPPLAPTDPALDILLNTALELVSRHGFDQVSTAQIARAAGFTEGLVFSRYATKLDMVIDATGRQNAVGMEVNHAFTEDLRANHSPAIAEAVLAREAQRPGSEIARSMALEQIRLGWHHPELHRTQQRGLDEFRAQLLTTPGWDRYETETDFFLQFCLSWGLYLLPFLNPEVYRLPYDTVLTPLYDAFDARAGGAA